MTRINDHLRKTFFSGFFAAIPLAITALLVWWIDQRTRALSRWIFRIDAPFLGVIIALGIIYVLGVVVNSILGRMFLHWIDTKLSHVPGLKPIYGAWKQVLVTPGGGTEGIFSKVVLVEDYVGWTLGFTSGKSIEGDADTLCVFVPAAPNPIAGRLYFVRREKCQFVDVSTEEAFKLVLSSGNYVPPTIGGKMLETTGKESQI